MALNGSRRGASSLAIPLMLLAFVLTGAFLFWLNATAEPTAPPVMDEDTDDSADMAGVTVLDPGQLSVGTDQYVGQRVRLEGVSVADRVGPAAFFISTPQNPFLVRMDSALIADGMTVEVGGSATVVGTVYVRTDSVVVAWQEDGSIGDNELPLVEFANHFILADRVQMAMSADSASGN